MTMKRVLALVVAAMLLCTGALAESISTGDRGDAVKEAQSRLIELGYLGGGADGIYGEKTAAAVSLFQYLNGMTPTGAVDEATAAALASDGARSLRPTLSGGDKGDEVQALQAQLIRFGFLTDGADGVYGKNTAAAVQAFQQHLIDQGINADEIYGVSADGVATGLTQEYLFSATYSTFLTALNPGDSGAEVRRIERRLAALGYLDAAPDEEYDDYAVSAVTAFQQDAGLEPTGALVRADVDALFSEDAPMAARYALHDVAQGDGGGVAELARQALIQYGFMSGLTGAGYDEGMADAVSRANAYLAARGQDALTDDDLTLTVDALEALLDGGLFGYVEDVAKGADALETARVQLRLSSLLYLKESGVDGDCGPATAEAIAEFQQNNGLESTGTADAATQAVLFSAEATGNWTPYLLEIRISEQRVHVYQLGDDGRYEEIDSFICSTGLGNSTPLGVFTDTTPINRWHWFEKFKCWAQYSYRITGNILFHSVLYDEADTATLRVNSVYALGSKASHGCVRLQVEDAKWIFENCRKGTIVRIVE